MERRIRVLIADDRPPSRNGLRALLASWSAVEAVYEAADGAEALRLAEHMQPDVILMDVCMPVMDGLEATRLLKRRCPNIRIIALSINATFRAGALSAGADGFLVKGCPTEDLLDAISYHAKARPELEKPTSSIIFQPVCAGLPS
jgi:DNA-binding NarL/FixJ family response regulator